MVAVVRNGELVYRRAFGLADVARKTPLTVDAVFDLASVAKQFTALSILLLAERGRLSIDDDVRKHLNELPVYDAKRPIRIRDLLHMISGLAGYQGLIDSYSGHTNESLVRLIAREKLAFPTGSKYEYSNTDYMLLAVVVERASGKSFGSFVRSEIFEPCGMTRSAVLEKKDQRIPGRVFGFAKEKGRWILDADDTPGIVGDGSVFSCVEDLARYDRALRSGRLAKKATLELAFTSGRLDSGRKTGYGCGWCIGTRQVFHSGGWNGTSTYFGRYLDRPLTVIVLSNQTDGAAEEIGAAVERIYLKE